MVLALISRKGVLFAVGLVALCILVWVAGSNIRSPASRAAETDSPNPSLVAVPVVSQVLDQTLVLRGSIESADSVEVMAGGDGSSAIVVTELPKERGAEVEEGEVVVEVSARPVIALEGDLPVFRDFRPGVEGPDVLQLELSLQRLGFSPGVVDESYTVSTGVAVRALYKSIGHKAAEPPAEEQEALQAAKAEVARSAQALRAAKKELADAEAASRTPEVEEPESEVELTVDVQDVADLRFAVDESQRLIVEAEKDLERLSLETGVSLSSSEIVFVPKLPQQVSRLNVELGDVPQGPVLSIASSETLVRSSVKGSDRELLVVGKEAQVTVDGSDRSIAVKIVEVAEEPGGDDLGEDQFMVVLKGVDQLSSLRDTSVKVSVPVSSTGGKVLAVPIAAISASVDQTSKIEILGAEGIAAEVTVEVGLVADGLVEVTAVGGDEIKEGDLVVVGRELKLPGSG